MAVALYKEALAIDPHQTVVHNNLAIAFNSLKHLPEALASADYAISLKPDYAEAYSNRSVIMQGLGRMGEALASADQAIAINPDFASAHYNRAITLHLLKRWDEALRSYERVLELEPNRPYALSNLLYCRMNLCVWQDFHQDTAAFLKKVDAGQALSSPFAFLAFPSSLKEQFECAQGYIPDRFPETRVAPPRFSRPQRERLRLGYFSADFHNHPVAYLTVELFARHDRSRFEVFGFSYDTSPEDEMRKRIRGTFDRFIDVAGKTDEQIAELAREMGIDIAIDLSGHTTNTRLGIFSHRAAPIQLHFLGYAGTIGAPYIDYLVADPTLIPEEHRRFYSEKIVYLPDSYMVSDSRRAISERIFTRKELGLPKTGFVFCCFNNSFKLTPDLFDVWMRLLKQVEGSVFWLSESSALAADNLRKEARARGVDPKRIVFAKRLERTEDHLARHRAADLFLDTFYYNAHTTANDALYAGLPVLTCLGETFASRVAASLLTAIDLPELITHSHREYEALALELATNPEKLNAIKAKLARNRLTSPLFDTSRFTLHLEDAYARIWERYQAGLPTEHLRIASQPTENQESRIPSPAKAPQGKTSAEKFFADALAAHRSGKLADAVGLYETALRADPRHAFALNNLSVALKDLKRLPEALACADRTISLAPNHADAHSNRSAILLEMGRLEEAVASADRAIRLNRNFASPHFNRGVALQLLQRREEAIASYSRAIELNPGYADAYSKRAYNLEALGRIDEALAGYDRAVAINPEFAEACYFRGILLQKLKAWERAAVDYDRAVSINPAKYRAQLMAHHCRMQACNWQEFGARTDKLLNQLEAGDITSTPIPVLALPSTLAQQKRCAEGYIEERFPKQPTTPTLVLATREKIRLGYFSADFHNHPVAYLTVELFARHDRSRFEVFGFSYDTSPEDDTRKRVRTTFDRFIDVPGKTDEQIAELAREMEIDIAIDLSGHTTNTRLGIFSHRAAPIQLHFLGYAGTIGAPYIDYLVADPTLIPGEHRCFYTEKIVYLPDTYMVSDSRRAITERDFTREELGLPKDGFVFCCFNNSFKLTPDLFDVWMRLLNKVEGSVLWLSESNPLAADNLRKEAQVRGVSPERIVFAKRLERIEDHLARHRAADLFLDTFYYNAHTTANDALYAGLPVLTCLGAAFASRVAASLLNAIGLPELVTPSHREYEALALTLATDPEKLNAIKAKLAQNRLNSPLFDTPRFTRHLEDAYRSIWARHQGQLPPEHIFVTNQTT